MAKITMTVADLQRLGQKAVRLIVERTQRGEGVDGPFDPYSTKTFAMPLGAITARARQALGEKLYVFRTKLTGALWAAIEGGYAAFKAAAYPQDAGTVNLTATGRMLQNLNVLRVDPSRNLVVLGFAAPEEAVKAWYVDEAGKHPRKFLGFTENEKTEMAAWAATRIIVSV